MEAGWIVLTVLTVVLGFGGLGMALYVWGINALIN